MNSSLFQAVCKTGIFMICAQAIVQFRPNESYEKYLKLLVGVMILVQLFLPLVSLFVGESSMEADALWSSFAERLEQGMEEAKRQEREMDALLRDMTLEEVRGRLEQEDVLEGEGLDDAMKVKEEGTDNGGNDILPREKITVEVEPVSPILREQTEGVRIDGE